MRKRQLFSFSFAIALAALAGSSCALAADYHGFRIDESARQLSPDQLASLQGQLDIVDAAGLPPAVLAAIKTTPIVVDPDLRGNPGFFAVRGGNAAVYVRPLVFAPNKPILLHELLHAYHFKVLGMDPEAARGLAIDVKKTCAWFATRMTRRPSCGSWGMSALPTWR